MSKSKGNVVDLIDWMERFGTDATRFTRQGRHPGQRRVDQRGPCAAAGNFGNKLWNATRFALTNGA